MADNQSDKVFQAIDGTELRQLILVEIAHKIDNDMRFRRHLTYPLVSFAFNIVVSAYPMEPPEFKIAGKVPYKRAVTPADGEPDVITIKGDLNIDAPQEGGLAPDEARERAGLPLPERKHTTVGKGAASITTDVPNFGTATEIPKFDPSKPASDVAEKIDPRDLVYDPVVVASGQATPSTMKPALPRNPNPGPPASPNVPKNRAGASPMMARSVDLKTRVTGDGEDGVARVDENIIGAK